MVYKSGQIFLPFCHNPHVRHTDGRTDTQTDRRTDRILIARPRLHSMQRGNQISRTEFTGFIGHVLPAERHWPWAAC